MNTTCSIDPTRPINGSWDNQLVWNYQPGQGMTQRLDALAAEAPLEIRVRGKAVCITMRTPGPDRFSDRCGTQASQEDIELAAGFLLSEGVIRQPGQIDRIAPCARAQDGDVINVYLRPEITYDPAQLTRHVFASSSCGICGKATIDAILADFPPLAPPDQDPSPQLHADRLAALPDRLREEQPVFRQTGGLHAAAIFDFDGRCLVVREDVGRHNAVDKVLGHLLLYGRFPLDEHVLVVSGRASFEIMQKALAARVPVVAAVSAPSSLAVEFAADSGQTLAGFVRRGRLNLYTHPQRILV